MALLPIVPEPNSMLQHLSLVPEQSGFETLSSESCSLIKNVSVMKL